jgi:hypothetical protein
VELAERNAAASETGSPHVAAITSLLPCIRGFTPAYLLANVLFADSAQRGVIQITARGESLCLWSGLGSNDFCSLLADLGS